MKRIGLVGFLGWGNFGDELFVETYRRYLSQDFEVSVIHDLLAAETVFLTPPGRGPG